MKVKVENNKAGFIYPCLMISNKDTIVFFKEHGEGVVLSGENHKLGCYSKDWDMYIFEPFKGKLILEND